MKIGNNNSEREGDTLVKGSEKVKGKCDQEISVYVRVTVCAPENDVYFT